MIEKLPAINEALDNPLIVALRQNEKINEVVKAVNDLLSIHPKLKETIEIRKTFYNQMKEDTPAGEKANND